jgi:hypothetical protein
MKWIKVRTPGGDVVRIPAVKDEDTGVWYPVKDEHFKYSQDEIIGVEDE